MKDEDDALLAEQLRPLLERKGVVHAALLSALDPDNPRADDPAILQRARRLVELATDDIP